MHKPKTLNVPRLLRSSKSLDWGTELEVREYLEPDTIHEWVDPITPEIGIIFLTRKAQCTWSFSRLDNARPCRVMSAICISAR